MKRSEIRDRAGQCARRDQARRKRHSIQTNGEDRASQSRRVA